MKTLKKVLFIGLMAFIVCLARTVQAQELYKNEKAPIHERIMDLSLIHISEPTRPY